MLWSPMWLTVSNIVADGALVVGIVIVVLVAIRGRKGDVALTQMLCLSWMLFGYAFWHRFAVVRSMMILTQGEQSLPIALTRCVLQTLTLPLVATGALGVWLGISGWRRRGRELAWRMVLAGLVLTIGVPVALWGVWLLKYAENAGSSGNLYP